MKEKEIRDAYCKIRAINNTISDDVLDFMLQASLEKLHNIAVKAKVVNIDTNYGKISL